jgi:hypothetical protein
LLWKGGYFENDSQRLEGNYQLSSRGVRTVQRWEMDGLPIRRPLPGKRRELEHEMQSPVADASAQSSHSPDNSVPRPSTDKTNEENSEAA